MATQKNSADCGESSEEKMMTESKHLKIDGETLNLKIENSYWLALEEISSREGMLREEIIRDIINHLKNKNYRRRIGSSVISNSIRAFIVDYYRQAATEEGHRRAGHGSGELFTQKPAGADDLNK